MQWYKHPSILCLQLLRLFQIVGAVACIVYYGSDVNKARKEGKYMDSRWVGSLDAKAQLKLMLNISQVYALVTGSMSLVTAFVYFLGTCFFEWRAFLLTPIWDGALTLLWIVVTGIFGKMYFGEKPEMDQGIQKMKVAAGFDVANLILWLLGTVWLTWKYVQNKGTLMHLGRGKMAKPET